MNDAGDIPWRRSIAIGSIVLCAAVGFLILGPRPTGHAGSVDVSGLPLVNATLNGLAASLLVAGWLAIKAGRRVLHRRLMLSASATSALFLLSYVTYHWFQEGPARYHGSFRAVYLVILLTHVLLAIAIVPLALTTLTRGLTGAFERHRRIAPTTLGLWLYVSITGVVIYWMAHG